MAAKGGTVADITVGDCLELLDVADQVAARLHGGAHSPLFYQLLLDRGGFPGDAPAAMRVFSGRGQPTCEQLIDRYGITCQPVRDVLVDYLAERKLASDFSSLQRLAHLLGKLFWADLEAHHPGIGTPSRSWTSPPWPALGGFWVSGPRAVFAAPVHSAIEGLLPAVLGSCTRLYVAVRGIGGAGARGRVHIVDSVVTANITQSRLRRSEGMWRCRQERSVKPTLVRTQHLPPVSAGQSR